MSISHVSRSLLALSSLCGLLFVMPSVASGQPANLGVQDYEVPGVQVMLLSVKRTADGFLTVRWAYRNTTASPQKIGANSGAMSGAWSAPYSLAWDFYVTANGTQYKTADSPSGEKLAGTHAGPHKEVVVGPHQTYATWAKVKDPGPQVTKVSVSIEGVAPFEDVPIS